MKSPLLLILAAGVAPLLIVVLYSFLAPGSYGDVKWEFSTQAWFSVFLERDIFDNTLSLADAVSAAPRRSSSLSLRSR